MHASRRACRAERTALIAAIPIATFFYVQHWYPGPGGRIWFGDSVSFQYYAISHSLGHSPGYPQYLALVRALARIPIGQAWQRVDFVSSCFGALALAAHYVLCRVLRLSALQACGAALTLGLSRTMFIESTEAEVYTLNLFWVLTCAGLFVWYLHTRRRRALYAFFVAFGCSLGHHPTMVMLVLPVAITVLCFDRGLFTSRHAYLAALLAIVIGLAQYLYTYRLFIDDRLSFRWLDYPEHSLTNFLDYTAGSHFREAFFSQPLAVVWNEKVPQLLRIAHAQNTIVLLVLGLCGLAAAGSMSASSRVFSGLCVVSYCAWGLFYNVGDIDAFCTPLWAFCYLGVVPGVQALSMPRATRTAFALVAAISLLGFQYSVRDTEAYHPNNDHLAIARECIGKLPANAQLMSFRLGDGNALPMLLRYLEASGDSGKFRLLRSMKHCVPGVYFTESSRHSVRAPGVRERRVGRLDRSGQDLFVTECAPAK